ncbi:unnamed protein product [Echinostoma caproni]|uniref:E3 ubiquitin-protein ligase n=1 Tax=Echinostoma caproni TaxID=27848 RepID=A0A183ASJ2_9TREM|nr:unnamed protein product [Echinostoma caproni]
MIDFIAQYNAKLWVRNGFAIQQSVDQIFSPVLRVEMIDRDLQLLQIGAAILPPDEFLVRMIHHLRLAAYLLEPSQSTAGRGSVQAVEMLLRTLINLVTNRSRPSIGKFGLDYIQLADEAELLKECVIDPELEEFHAALLDDVVHTLCVRPMICSELLHHLPYQPVGCLLRVSSTNKSNSSVSLASSSRRANRLGVEQVLPRILQQIATQSSVSGRIVFTLKPEVMAFRFNRFHWGYRHAEQTQAEANVTKSLKRWLVDMANRSDVPQSVRNNLSNMPLPPPAPRPLRLLLPSVAPNLLRLVSCSTFVRLIRTLLDIALTHGNSSSWWSDTLLDLTLHLITIALYEDELESHWTWNYFKKVAQMRERVLTPLDAPEPATTASCAPSPGSQTSHISTVAALRQHRAEQARERQSKIMARMSKMQRTFISAYGHMDTEERTQSNVPITTDPTDQSGDEEMLPDEGTVQSHGALGPNRSIVPIQAVISSQSATPAKTITCSLCLEAVDEKLSSGMVIGAHVCRSSVLSSDTSAWLEGLSTVAVCDRLSSGHNTREISSRMETAMELDQSEESEAGAPEASTVIVTARDSSFPLTANEERSLYGFLAAAATTVTALGADQFEEAKLLLQRLCANLPLNMALCPACKSVSEPIEGSGEKCACRKNLRHLLETLKSKFDQWHARPLVASRDPIADEGSFISCCSHPMHAVCKLKYGRVLKSRVNHVNRHRVAMQLVYQFRCPLCKAISTLDLPVLESLLNQIPPQWLQKRFLSETLDPILSCASPTIAARSHFQTLPSWLVRLRQWLDYAPHPSERTADLPQSVLDQVCLMFDGNDF